MRRALAIRMVVPFTLALTALTAFLGAMAASVSCSRQVLDLVPEERVADSGAGGAAAVEETGGASGGGASGAASGSGGFFGAGGFFSGGFPNFLPGRPCDGDGECGGATPQCDRNIQRCVECWNDTHCGPDEACDPGPRRCAERCAAPEDCQSSGRRCDEKRHVCVECTESAHCQTGAFGDERLCDPTSERCVECFTTRDCSAGKPICDAVRRHCEACAEDGDCAESERCNGENECVSRR